MKHASPQTLAQQYDKLSEPVRTVLQLWAVCGGINNTHTLTLLRKAAQPSPRGQSWNTSDLSALVYTLRQLKLADERNHCCPELAHSVALDFANACAAEAKEACALRDALLDFVASSPSLIQTHLHSLLYLGKNYAALASLMRSRSLLNTDSSLACEGWFRGTSTPSLWRNVTFSVPLVGSFNQLAPEAESWFAALPPEGRLDILVSNLFPLLQEGIVTPCLPWMLPYLPALRPQLETLPPIPALILFDILAGRFVEAKTQLVPLLMDKTEPMGTAFLGMIDFFEGHNSDALTNLREARKRYRRLRGKRRIQMQGVPGLCFALALVRAEDPALQDELRDLLQEVPMTSPERRGFTAAAVLQQLASNDTERVNLLLSRAFPSPCREPLSAALSFAVQLLAFQHLTAHKPTPNTSASQTETAEHARLKRLMPQQKDVYTLFLQYRDILPLVGCVLAESLAHLTPNAEPYTTFIFEQKPEILFLSFLGDRESWERLFDTIEHVLCPKGTPATSTAKLRKKRLVWLLDPENFELEPLEQTSKQTKAGEDWSSGRVASLKRLFEQYRTLDWLTEQDRRILDTLELENTWNGMCCRFDIRNALCELAGHPLLFEKGTRRPLTLRCQPVELVVRQKGAGYVLSLSPVADFGSLLVKEAPDAYCLYLLPEKLGELATILGKGLEIPEKGAARVLQLLREHDPEVSVRAEIQAEELTVADARPVARLKPLGTGLEVTLLVRPFGCVPLPTPDNASDKAPDSASTTAPSTAGEGKKTSKTPPPAAKALPALPNPIFNPTFPPGQGNPQPLTTREGKTLRAHRDLDAEQEAAQELCRECPVLREQGGLGPWIIEETEEALQCLLELQSAPSCAGLEWPEGETLRVRPAVSAATMSVQVRSSRDWFQLEGKIQVNESLVLDMRRVLESLDEAKGCFVPLGNGEFLALTRQFRQQLERLRRLSEPAEARRSAEAPGSAEQAAASDDAKARKTPPKTAVRVHHLGAGAVQALLDAAGCVDADAAWHDLTRRIHEASAVTPVVPSTLRAELREYQAEGFAWLSRLSRWAGGACLADDMGLGKTVQTIAVLLEQAPHGPSVILAPTSVCHNWENEITRFAPTLTCHRFTGTREARAELVRSLGAGDILVASYGLLHTEIETLATRAWRMAVFDEAQALKNAETKRARASKQIPAVFRVALTGTPIENYLEDLWSLFATICPGLLGTKQSFQRRFSGPIGAGGIGPVGSGVKLIGQGALGGTGAGEARQALKALVRPFILRRTKSAVLTELPPRTEQIIEVDLPEDERAFYEALRRHALEELEKKKAEQDVETGVASSQKFTILTELTKLRRACCHPALIDPQTRLKGAKLTAFMELVGELVRGGHKALVFSQFVGHLAQVRHALDVARVQYQYLDGSTPERERQRSVKAFQSGEGDLFLISLKAGGQGLNLTAADYVIHLDPWWNPAVEDQASDRAHRMGQERPVTVYRLVIRDSVEERILKLHRSKRSLAADFLEGTDTSAALSENELLALLT